MSVGISLGTAALIGGVASAGGAVASGLIGAHAAGSAADKQVTQENQALDFQKQVYSDQKANQAPYLEAGKTSLAKLMEGFTNGTFGPGSIPQFKAPTAAEAAQTPGYEFTRQQGNRGVLAAASAGGRSLSGGTLKALDQYNTGLASTTYGDTFNRALQTYQAQLAGKSQDYNELAGVAGTGQTATQNINSTGTATAANVGNLMSQIGSAQAGGILGSANSINAGIGSGVNGITQAMLLQSLYGSGAFGAPYGGINAQGGLGTGPLPQPPATPPFVEEGLGVG